MPGTVLHERPAKVSAGQAPRLGKVTYTITKVGLRLRQIGRCTPEAEQLGCLWSDLHQSDLADSANSSRIVPALNPHYRVNKGRRDAIGCCLVGDGRKVCGPIFQGA
jgi:hypothetical protein